MTRRPHRRRTGLLVCVVIALAAAGCSSKSDGSSGASSGAGPALSSSQPPSDAAAPLTIVVTNDDGIGAPGIDVLAQALRKLPDVKVVVVAPATNQSATGDKTTAGGAKYHPAATQSGIQGYAVEGFPADTVAVALDELHLKPNLVASGVNRGQNVGPLASISGTVGAAFAAARRQVPAVAGSAGITDNPDYAGAAALMVHWITANRAQIAAGTMPTDVVVSFNVPECTAGAPRKLVQVAPADKIPEGSNPFTADCSAPPPDAMPTNDVQAIAEGFEAETKVPVPAK